MTHSGCITQDGKVYLWGIIGDTEHVQKAKKQVLLKVPTEVSFSKYKNVQIQDLKMGEGFSIALSKQGEVFAWGMNDQG